jgi:CDP-paratose 2-epimerase
MRVLVTGSSGLIGSEAVRFFDGLGFAVTGIDNNMRADFFGPQGDTLPVRQALVAHCRRFTPLETDVRDRAAIDGLFRSERFELVVHAAAQPSHDLAARRPFDDFDVNAVGTLNLLEACRRHSPEAAFIHVSTNKVYGDGPNRIPMRELPTRWDYDDPAFVDGIGEHFPVDHCLHSLFGVSKAAGDLMAQEYGRYFGLRTGIFRAGCLTGPQHAGVELHGFLSHLVRTAMREAPYTIHGYQGKQVRDQLHSADAVSAFWEFAQEPRPGEVYNLGGGRANAASVLECIALVQELGGRRPRVQYSDTHRVGDHRCYFTDMGKFRSHFPQWRMRHGLRDIVKELVAAALPNAAA